MNLSIEETRYIKGIAILAIVLGHLGMLYKGGGIGVHLFLFVSGYGCIRSYCESGIKNFWNRKIRRIYLPYLILAVIKYPSTTLMNGGVKDFLISVAGLDLGVNIEMWYISYIFMWYFIFYILIYLSYSHGRSKVFISLNIIMFSVGLFVLMKNKGFLIWHSGAGADLYTFSFPCGVLCGCLPNTAEKNETIVTNIVLFVAACSIFFKLYGNCETYNACYIYFVVGAIIVITLCNLRVYVLNRIILAIGKMSYMMFLINGEIIIHIEKYFGVFGSEILQKIVCFFAIVLIGYILNQLFYESRFKVITTSKGET